MNLITMLIGSVFVLLGLYAEYSRLVVPDKLKKLEPMKNFWGEKKGALLHCLSYVITPIVIGTVIVVGGFRGLTLLDVLKQL